MIEEKFDPPLETLIKRLDKFEDTLRSKALRAGVVAAIKPLKVRMKALAPRQYGALEKSIGHRALSKSAKARVGVADEEFAFLVGSTIKVGATKESKISQAYKALWMEFGTTPHVIKARSKKYLASGEGRWFYGKKVNHPGTGARRFMERARMQTGHQLGSGFYQGLTKHLGRYKNLDRHGVPIREPR